MASQVVHLTTAHTATDTRIFEKEAVSLANSGYEVTLICHNGDDETRQGVHIRSLGTTKSRPIRWSHIYTATKLALQEQADVYHFHDPELLPAGLYLAEATDAVVIYDIHEDFGHIIQSRDWIPPVVKPLLSQGFPVMQNLAARRFDALVTVSNWVADTLPDNVRTEVVRNFPRTSTLPDAPADVERDHEHVLVYVGGLSEIRGILRMLYLLHELRDRGLDIELWALGQWQNSKQEASHFINSYGLSDYVRFPGYLDYDDMFRWLRSADIGLALLDETHYSGGIPTKLFEYMYSELPVIGTRVDAAERFLNDEYYWAVSPDDVEKQADTVEDVLGLDTGSTGEQARKDVEEKFSWEQEFRTLEELYADLLQ